MVCDECDQTANLSCLVDFIFDAFPQLNFSRDVTTWGAEELAFLHNMKIKCPDCAELVEEPTKKKPRKDKGRRDEEETEDSNEEMTPTKDKGRDEQETEVDSNGEVSPSPSEDSEGFSALQVQMAKSVY